MKQQTKARKSFSALAVLSLAVSALVGCAGQVGEGEGETPEYEFAVRTEAQWTHCAMQGEFCAFSGTKQVRFGTEGKTVTKSFTGGVDCTNRAFGQRFGRGKMCEVLLDVQIEDNTPAPDAGMNHDMGGMVMGNDAGMDMSGMAGMTGTGPSINRALIPKGDVGVSTREIGTTSEKPTPNDVGAFRTSCLFSHMNFDDPIVFPNQPGKAHLHSYFGNTGANANSTAESLRNTGNSTCRGGIANRSAYWVPAVIDKTGTPIAPIESQVYYKTGYEGIAPQEVKPFPQGLRMIAGDAKSTTTQTRAYWGCETYIGHVGAVPTCPANELVIMYVQFPQCWNGRDLDSTDHKSHMSYPVNGRCPSTHPVAIPEISFNIYYKVPAGSNSKDWRLASDMYDAKLPGGYSAHGDWFEGWDPEIVKTFVKNCNNASVDCHSHLLGDGRTIFNSHEK